MTSGKKILILGASTWQVPYLKKAKELGCKVYSCEWSPTAPGRVYADVFEPIDLKDKEKVLEFAREHQVEGVMSAADLGVPTAAYVAENMGLPFHNYELTLNATNKYRMRKKAAETGVPGPQFRLALNVDEAKKAAQEIGYPVIIKPTDNWSSRGVSTLNDDIELENAFQNSIESSFSSQVLIEELMRGTEGSVEALVKDGKAYIMGVCDKEKSPLPYRYDLQLNYPGRYTENQYQLINEFIDKLVSGYGIKEGIIHVEIMVGPDSVRLIEFGLRGCGSNVISHLIPNIIGFDVIAYLVKKALGLKEEIEFTENKGGILKFIMLQQGKIKSMEGLQEVKASEGVMDFHIEKQVGDNVEFSKDGRSRPGYIIGIGETLEKAENLITLALNKLQITYY